MNLASFSVKNSQFTFIIFIGVVALGIASLLSMPRAEDPEFSPPGFIIVHVLPGASPTEMEDLVSNKLEERLGTLQNIDRMISFSGDGVSILNVEFPSSENADTKYQDIVREVNSVRPKLPKEIVRSEITQFTSADVAILQAALISENASFPQLKEKAELLEKRLEKIKGIRDAHVFGIPTREIRVELNLPKMASQNIPVARVLQILESENLNIPGGSIQAGDRKFNVQTSGDFSDIEEVKNTVIFAAGGKTVFLKDIADISHANGEPTHICRANGHRAVFITATMQERKNIFEVGENINLVLEEWKSGLPANMKFERIFDQNKSVGDRLGRFAKDFLIAIGLVALTLLPLGWRAAGIVMISIPLSLSIGLALLNLFGYSLNQLSIAGLIVALGILVDDSIVVVENIERWLRTGISRTEAAINGTKQITLAVLGCTAALIMAFLPILFLPDKAGDFIRSLPMAVVTTVFASLFVSLTIVPFLASRLLSKHEKTEGNMFLRGLKWLIGGSYARLLHRALQWPKTTMLVAVLIFGAVLSLAKYVGFGLFPESERPMFYIDIHNPPGANIAATDRTVASVDSVLRQFLAKNPDEFWQKGQSPRIKSFTSNTGHGNPQVYYNVMPRNESADIGQVFVQLLDKTPASEKLKMIEELRQKFTGMAGAKVFVKNFEQGPPIPAPIELRVFGENLDTLRQLAAEVENMVAETEGTLYVSNPIKTITTDLFVKINKEKAGLLGIPSAEVDRTVRLAIAGLETGRFTDEKGDETAIVVSIPHGKTVDLSVFNSLYINSLSGASVPLNQIAEVEMMPATTGIYHRDKDRVTSISASVKPGFLAQDLNNIFKEKLKNRPWPTGYHFQVAGEEESKNRSFGGMGTILLITLFGFLGILVLEFKTFKSTLIVLSVIPLGIIGAILILLATGYPFSFTVVVGLIALIGIEVKNSILLVDFTNQLRQEGRPLDDAIQEAGEIRFVPIVLTSLTAIGGLLPLAVEHNPLYSPLAWVIIGGLISSTLLSRIVTPVLYKLLPPRV